MGALEKEVEGQGAARGRKTSNTQLPLIHCRTVHLTLYWHFDMCSSKQSDSFVKYMTQRNFVWGKKSSNYKAQIA